MNRCITCGRLVSRSGAQTTARYEGHEYLVCCPLCEKEFERNPKHYVAVARTLFGDYTVKAHTQTGPAAQSQPTAVATRTSDITGLEHMVRSIQGSFNEIEGDYRDLIKHFERLTDSSGLEGLRNAMAAHHEMMSDLRQRLSTHAGACRFALAVAESPPDSPTERSHEGGD